MSQGEVILPAGDLNEELSFFTERLGFRLEQIFPAEDPMVAVVSGHGLRLRLCREIETPPGVLRIDSNAPSTLLDGAGSGISPGGTRVEIHDTRHPFQTAGLQPSFQFHRLGAGDPWVIGRAGMLYRDLVPDRLGGGLVASHIRIPNGGPVPDMPHYHSIRFQMIYCLKGWVRLVYEDQGPPFILMAGDCVTQPPEIRHQVLEASGGLEVIELCAPAAHMTTIDHAITLPTGRDLPDRDFSGQTFCHHIAETAEWSPWKENGLIARDTEIAETSGGLADVRIVRRGSSDGEHSLADDRSCFHYVIAGSADFSATDVDEHSVRAGDAFILPSGMDATLSAATQDFEMLVAAFSDAL